MTTEQFAQKQANMTNLGLIELAEDRLKNLCKTGGQSLTMSVPPSIYDTDMLFCELIRRFRALTGNDLTFNTTTDLGSSEITEEHGE